MTSSSFFFILKAWQGKAGPGEAWQGRAGPGEARQGKAWFKKSRGVLVA